MSDDARHKAATLAKDIWRGIWPHIEMEKRPDSRSMDRDRPDPSMRLAPLTSGDDVQPDDLLISIPVDRNYHYTAETLDTHTARESVGYFNARVVRVHKATGKTLSVYDTVSFPLGGFAGANLEALGNVHEGEEPVTYRLGSAKRLIARLGPVEEIRQRLREHPLYADWTAAYAAAVVEEQEAEAATAKWAAEQERRLAPLRTAIADFNRITGEELVKLSAWDDKPEIREPWLREDDRMRIYLAGLNAVGRLDDDQHAAALNHLRTLGLNTAAKEGDQ
ncbi:hypothetical protein ACWGQT_07350 [Streptomyces yangpuensis]